MECMKFFLYNFPNFGYIFYQIFKKLSQWKISLYKNLVDVFSGLRPP